MCWFFYKKKLSFKEVDGFGETFRKTQRSAGGHDFCSTARPLFLMTFSFSFGFTALSSYLVKVAGVQVEVARQVWLSQQLDY